MSSNVQGMNEVSDVEVYHDVYIFVQIFAGSGESFRSGELEVPQLVLHAAVEFVGILLPFAVELDADGRVLTTPTSDHYSNLNSTTQTSHSTTLNNSWKCNGHTGQTRDQPFLVTSSWFYKSLGRSRRFPLNGPLNGLCKAEEILDHGFIFCSGTKVENETNKNGNSWKWNLTTPMEK